MYILFINHDFLLSVINRINCLNSRNFALLRGATIIQVNVNVFPHNNRHGALIPYQQMDPGELYSLNYNSVLPKDLLCSNLIG